MLATIARLFTRKPAAPAPIINDMPAHKGFAATMHIGAMSMSRTFPTLHQAQVWLAMHKRESNTFRAMGRARGIAFNSKVKQSIRNLESGRFAPYRW